MDTNTNTATVSFIQFANKVFGLSTAFHQFFLLPETFIQSHGKTTETSYGEIDTAGASHMTRFGLERIFDVIDTTFIKDTGNVLAQMPENYRSTIDPSMIDFHMRHLAALTKIWNNIHKEMVDENFHFDALVFQSVKGKGKQRTLVLPDEYRFKLHINERFVGFNFYPARGVVEMVDESERIVSTFKPDKIAAAIKSLKSETEKFASVIDEI